MRALPARATSLQCLQQALCSFVDELGVSQSATLIGVSTDTMRRRIRNEQPWFFEEVLDLAREEVKVKHNPIIADELLTALKGQIDHDYRPLRIPSELREVLRLVGRLTTDIADTLDDGKVDAEEAVNLLELLARLDDLTAHVKQQLKALIAAESGR